MHNISNIYLNFFYVDNFSFINGNNFLHGLFKIFFFLNDGGVGFSKLGVNGSFSRLGDDFFTKLRCSVGFSKLGGGDFSKLGDGGGVYVKHFFKLGDGGDGGGINCKLFNSL